LPSGEEGRETTSKQMKRNKLMIKLRLKALSSNCVPGHIAKK
jgi:hypothetical protein